MSKVIVHKKGDSIRWNVKYNQSSGTAYDLTSFTIIVSIKDRINNISIVDINNNIYNGNHQITTDQLNIGKFQVIIKDTSSFPTGDYYVDIQYTDVNGFKQSSESFDLKIVNRK